VIAQDLIQPLGAPIGEESAIDKMLSMMTLFSPSLAEFIFVGELLIDESVRASAAI
jgi:hypothetical protein